MSTIFGVKLKGKMIEVAHRRAGEMVWLNQEAESLPDKKRVYPLDNSSQGIHTIEDIKFAIRTGNICL